MNVLANSNTDAIDPEAAYQWAIDAGFSEHFVSSLTDEALQKVYYDNSFGDELEITTTEVELDERLSVIQPFGTIKPEHMTLRITTSKVIQIGMIHQLNVYVTYKWSSGRPIMSLTDGVVINWDPDDWTYKPYSFSDDLSYISNNDGKNYFYSTNTTPSEINQGGIGWYVELWLLSGLNGYTAPNGFACLTLLPKTQELYQNGTDYSMNINCNYGHKTLGFSVSFSLSGPNVEITGENDSAGASTVVYYSK